MKQHGALDNRESKTQAAGRRFAALIHNAGAEIPHFQHCVATLLAQADIDAAAGR